MPMLRQALRFIVPRQRRARVVTVLAVLSLALGIAGNAVVFSLVDSLIHLRLPYTEPERIVLLGQRENTEPDAALASILSALPVWADFRERSSTLTEWAAITLSFMSVSDEDRSVAVMVGSATPSFFRVLGEQTVRGRVFTDLEGVEGGPKVAILTWDYWQNAMGAIDDPVGTVLTLDGVAHEVIGALPDGYDFLTPDVGIWLPMQQNPYESSRSARVAISVARMAPGVTMAQVKREMAQIAGELEAEYPETFRGWTMSATNLGTEFPDPQSRTYLAILRASVFFVLLIACANITNLLLARSQERTREIAVRTALGAGRLRILGQLGRESTLMAVSGGVIGLSLTAVGIRIIGGRFAQLPFVPSLFEPRLDTTVVLFTVAMTLLCALIVGIFPALQSFRVDQVEALKQGRGGGGGGHRAPRLTAALVVAQIALSLVALGAGLALARSFTDTMNKDPGFEAEGLLAIGIEVPDWKYELPEGTELIQQLRDRVERLPDVVAAALVTPLPKNLVVVKAPLLLAGQVEDVGVVLPQAQGVWASPEFLQAFEVPLLQGRFFEPADRMGAEMVVVVNRALADRHFADRNPVGQHVTFLDRSREIVGVIGNVQQGIVPESGGGFGDVVYLPVAQNPRATYYLVVRTAGTPRAVADPIRAEVRNLDADLAVNTVETMQEYAARYTVTLSLFNDILSAFGVLALLLASLGTYGVIAYSVAQRSQEIGVRMTLGADARTVVGMIAMQGLKMTVLGLAIGTVLLVPLMAVISNVLRGFGLEPVAPLTLVYVGLVLFTVSAVASVVPATRAATVDPVSVLRAD
ncbi:MAG: ABC transporter permease [Gemmatimonadetes bacterium]|nr:ABC transporter permease [Gemmatimonadota bacterium]